jgi:hypothetical protein
MLMDFALPEGLIGRFGVVKLWPEIKAAEDECIARLKIAASAIGVECVEVNHDGTFISNPEIVASDENVDFVIHLHFDTPKLYDAFSFVALWNPMKFYQEWGYARCSRNLTTHDDFISCSSFAADDHVRRMIRGFGSHLSPRFKLYHSTADILHPPSLGDGKLAYAGINWDALKAGKSRHQEVLRRLDGTGLLRIFGPKIFMGVQVWAGYESYVREVPFDGVSMVNEISNAGIALVLSSQAHKEAGLMSNRLFESVAAGALVICDENPFARRHFGDCLLYIDSRASVDQIVTDITAHLAWAKSNPDLALAMIERSQAIFRQGFSLIQNLSALYEGLLERKEELRHAPAASPRVRLNLLMPEFSMEVLHSHVQSAMCQDYDEVLPALVVDVALSTEEKQSVRSAIDAAAKNIELIETNFYEQGMHQVRVRQRTGTVIQSLIDKQRNSADAFMVVAPNESILSNHVRTLANALGCDETISTASTAAILDDGETRQHSVHETLDFNHFNKLGPTGYGRFIFRMSAIPLDIDSALPYLDGKPLAVLVGNTKTAQQLAGTVRIDIRKTFPDISVDDAVENEVIRSFAPGALTVSTGVGGWAAPPPTISGTQLLTLMTNRAWVSSQIHSLRTHGLKARLRAFKRKVLS